MKEYKTQRTRLFTVKFVPFYKETNVKTYRTHSIIKIHNAQKKPTTY